MWNSEGKGRTFAAHIEDLLYAATERYHTGFTGFLNLQERTEASRLAAPVKKQVMFFGGYSDAERVMMGAFSPDETISSELFPIVPVTIRFRQQDPIGHRDLLGALLGMGLSRETVGDILLEKGQGVCFLTPPAANLALETFCKAGRWGLQLERGLPDKLPERRFEEIQIHVSSLRLDCIAAALTRLSREKAQKLIESGKAAVNGTEILEPAFQTVPGTVLSLRGYGKYIFDQTLRTTKKDRLVLQCRRYL